jgi:hypothetical protein
VYLAISRDGGKSFENIKISESPFIPSNSVFFGDYTNIAAANNIIRPIWARMDNFKMSILTALIDGFEISPTTEEPKFEESFFELYNNDPNPYNEKTAISFKLHRNSRVNLEIYNTLGNKISNQLNNKYFDAGKHTIAIDNAELNLKPGIYYYVLRVENKIKSKKMIIQ